jgi:class 3 adenylate cyclase
MNAPIHHISLPHLSHKQKSHKKTLFDIFKGNTEVPTYLREKCAGLRLFLLVSLLLGVALCFLQHSDLFFRIDSLFLSLTSEKHYTSLPTGFMVLVVMFHTLLPGILVLEEGLVKGIIYTVVIWFFYGVLIHSYSSSLAFYLPLSAPLIGCVLSLIRVVGWEHTFLKKEKEEVKKTFGSFVDPRIADILLNSPDAVNENGQHVTVTVMFADLRDFTSLCEHHPPETVIEMLRDCFGKLISIVRNNGGVVDKLMGDSMMVVWGNPIPSVDHAEKAVESAIEMQTMMKVLKKKWFQRLGVDLKMGIGINTDEVVAGTIGSAGFCDYTVLGRGVNLASSIESVCPGDKIYISENTFSQLCESFACSRIDNLCVKNDGSISVYQVLI